MDMRGDPARALGASRDLGRVPVCEGRVGVQVAMAQWMVRALDGLAPEPVLPVTPAMNSRGSTKPAARSGTIVRSAAVAKQPGCATCGVGARSRCSGTAQVNSRMRAGAPWACL